MTNLQKIFWALLVTAIALLVLHQLAGVVHVTIEFGKKQPDVLRLEAPALDDSFLRALPPAPGKRGASMRFGVSKATCAAPLGVAAPRSPFSGVSRILETGCNNLGARRVVARRAEQIFSYTREAIGRPVVVHTVIRDGRERGLSHT